MAGLAIFFQRKANARHKRNTIHVLHGPTGPVSTTDAMTELAHDHFTQTFGTVNHRSVALNWDELDLEHVDLADLEQLLSMEEVKRAVDAIPADKAPGPDGFSGGFYKTCWDTIKHDLLAALNQLFRMDSRGLDCINRAILVLIPKKLGADAIQDFRPISLLHSVIKIFSKILALRLAPKLNTLVDQCQSAFIKKRSIQENFLNTARFFQLPRILEWFGSREAGERNAGIGRACMGHVLYCFTSCWGAALLRSLRRAAAVPGRHSLFSLASL